MKILSAEQIRQADRYTIAHEPISSAALMERASAAFTNQLLDILPEPRQIIVLAGMGNNGGDGLCIGRNLRLAGWPVTIVAVRYSDTASADFQEKEKQAKAMADLTWIDLHEGDALPPIDATTLIIDALWGSGLNRPIAGWPAQLIDTVNQSTAEVVAVDIPSGLYADAPVDGPHIRANLTITFQAPKLSFMMADHGEAVGDWVVVDIGLHPNVLEDLQSPYHVIDDSMVMPLLPLREKFDHKGTFGHGLLIGGRFGSVGAATLSAMSCLRTGAGLVTAHLPQACVNPFQAAFPEAMVSVDEGQHRWEAVPDLAGYTAIGIGPGIGTDKVTQKALLDTIEQVDVPLVIDADGLNILAHLPGSLDKLPENTILTPHPGELARLVGKTYDSFTQLERASELAEEHHLIVVLKGGHTAVCLPDGQIYFNATGNPGMATAGSGDVLTGMITGLLAQGLDPDQAAMAGVFLHGLAGDLAAADLGEHALVASDIIGYIGEAYQLLD